MHLDRYTLCYRLSYYAFAGILFFISTTEGKAQDTTQYIIRDRVNSPAQQKKPYVIMISADGFRYDLADKDQATNLLKFRDEGVHAEYLEPSFPSLTFPNHYTLATGLYPSHSGLVDNRFYDPAKSAVYSMRDKAAVQDSSWYGGVPLWVLAEQEHMLSASFYWVGSESAIAGIRPTYYYHYNEAIPLDDRILAVRNWLQLPPEVRPHLIMFYFPEVDHAEHTYGPDSWQAKAAVRLVDQSVAKLVSAVSDLDLPVNFIFVSDHGMTRVDSTHLLTLPASIDTTKFVVSAGATLVHLYARNPDDIKPAFQTISAEAAKQYDVFLAAKMPPRWHYGKKDDRYGRIGDILLVAREPSIFGKPGHIPVGEHGYDPAMTDMHATFYAWGPAFKAHQTIRGFENVNVYPLVAKILGLDIVEDIDGKLGDLNGTLK